MGATANVERHEDVDVVIVNRQTIILLHFFQNVFKCMRICTMCQNAVRLTDLKGANTGRTSTLCR